MYYRITSEDEARLRENCTNIVKRHCRIGKVSPKPPKHWGKLTLPTQPVIPAIPNTGQTPWGPLQWWQNPIVSVC